jgi:hypothetical protein
MPDFSKLKAAPKEERPTDPIAIFQRLRVTDSSINDLWLAQGDALRAWHSKREETDVAISLNTGAGKTLVGLLVGQSLVNELRSMVLYACSSIQLVLQTAKKAEGYGLPCTTYVRGSFNNDLAAKGEAVCLTTYQALFNGKSRFLNREVAGIVFDDAHAAEHLLRDHFSMHITKERFQEIYSVIVNEFTDYFHAVGLSTSFEEVLAGTGNRLLLVPPFEVRKVHSEILKKLQESSVCDDDNTTFAWAHLKDRIDLCAFIISSMEVTITPAFVPVRTLPYFYSPVRRVYLSATLPSEDVFVRTFGRKPSLQITPTTTAGECERMILIPQKIPNVVDDLVVAKKAIEPHKALILVPSYARAKKRADLVEPPPRESATEAIEEFKQAKGAKKLLLTARYDGVDLPGDMCRVVVIDDLPTGIGPLERFLWEYLKFSSTLRSAVASRVVQSFGRISRGMSDHGVAIITGNSLVEWLQVPKNVSSLPRFLQKQLQLGFQMSGSISSTAEVGEMIQSCLGRHRDWIEAYERFMREAGHEEDFPEPGTVAELALAEAKFAADLWHRDFPAAALHLKKVMDAARDFSSNTACWHKLWLGYALECAGDSETATMLYNQAHAGMRNIPALRPESSSALPIQAVSAARQFELVGGDVRVQRSFDRDLLFLNGTGTVKQTEEALRCLGQYLGFDASRPEQEHGTGPDVLWIFPDKTGLCVDAKTEKGTESTPSYRKEDLGQLSQHVECVKENGDVKKIIPAFIGPEVAASKSGSPPPGVKVASLSKFYDLGETVKAAYRDIAAGSLPLTVGQSTLEQFRQRGLLWPELERTPRMIELRDLKGT